MISSSLKQAVKRYLPPRAVDAIAVASGKRAAGQVRPGADRFAGEDASVLQCCIAYNSHGGFCIPLESSHRPACAIVLAGEIHEPDTIRFIATHRGNGDVVHAGTYFGDFLPELSRSCAPGARVWAFEPDLEHYRCARITLMINDCQHIELCNAGLGDAQEIRSMVTSNRDGQSLGGAKRIVDEATSLTEMRVEGMLAGNQTKVKVIPIDAAVPPDRHVSILHLDVEGYEQQALSGAMGTIQRCRPIIIVETVPEPGWLTEHLTPLGYRESEMVQHNTVFRAG